MSQNLGETTNQDSTQDSSSGNKTTVTGSTGSICSRTGLYKASDGKTSFIELIDQGQAFPPYPGGNGKAKCTWTSISTTEGSSQQSFESVLVPAGTA